MNRFAAVILALSLWATAGADGKHPRPKILGIASVHFYSTDLSAARKFYAQILEPGVACCKDKSSDPIAMLLWSKQSLTLTTPEGPAPASLLAEIVFATDNAKAMREYFDASHIPIETSTNSSVKFTTKSGSETIEGFAVSDPEGHRIGFVQASAKFWPSPDTDMLRIIHAGFVVRDRAAEDRFYKDLLGFHLYWHGGMKDDQDDWVAMQVPDGTDWIEYMLNISPNADHRTLGVMNHIALGVTDIHVTEKQLIANGWKPTEEPKLGRDGKWQLNVYDPDDTRTEFMEFKPKEAPCCSAFTGSHPGPK